MFLPEEFIISKPAAGYKNACLNMLQYVKHSVNIFFKDKPLFNDKCFDYYFFDDYVLKTNINEPGFITLYLEINQPKNIKADFNKKLKRKDSKIKNLHLTLEEIKKGFFEVFGSVFGDNTLIWQDRYSIKLSVTEVIKNERVITMFNIIPCFTYINENGVKGVIYYKDDFNDVEIEYPKLSVNNFNSKNKETNGNLQNYVLLFKNIFKHSKEVKELPTEIFEIILYNTPKENLTDLNTSSIIKLLNFLRNKDIREYTALDEQDKAFTSKYKSLSAIYAKHVINTVEKFIKNKL